jgi:hypothetical protein
MELEKLNTHIKRRHTFVVYSNLITVILFTDMCSGADRNKAYVTIYHYLGDSVVLTSGLISSCVSLVTYVSVVNLFVHIFTLSSGLKNRD